MGDLIRMARSVEEANGGPLTADVHPDEVANYALSGFQVVEDADIAVKPKTATELITLIMAAATEADVDIILGSDERKTVVAAAATRKAELAPKE
ncbi:MAG: hypothetical protein HXX17_15675 [Geobacteraceae bacterium]|nr:hypothetical protein [Geobacteraceae bacterium]